MPCRERGHAREDEFETDGAATTGRQNDEDNKRYGGGFGGDRHR
jgi:hypothetical protein